MTKAIIWRSARKIDIAIFKECGRLWRRGRREPGEVSCNWIAADITTYHVAQGHTPMRAVENLIFNLRAHEVMVADALKNGERVVRINGAKKFPRDVERLRKKAQWIIRGVDWREWGTNLRERYYLREKHWGKS